MFRTVPLPIIRSFSLYTQQTYMTSPIAVCTVTKTPDDVQRNCPKQVQFYSKNKFEKLLYLVFFIIRRFRCRRENSNQIDARETECNFVEWTHLALGMYQKVAVINKKMNLTEG